jgi:outer membrane protein assembly factor BamD (BamD/ComL family)
MPRSLLLLLFGLCFGFTAGNLPEAAADTWWPTFGSAAKLPPGTPAWWKKHKKKAEFVPGKGYRVDGFDGFYDQMGRPINAPAPMVVKREKQAGGLLNDMKLTSTVKDVKSKMGMGPDEKLARAAMASGEELFRKEKYGEAAKQFEEVMKRWPDSQLEQDAMFQLAESRFFGKQYPKAVDAYDALLVKYPNSNHLDKVITRQFSIARYWEAHHQYDPHWVTTPNLIDRTRPTFDTCGRAVRVYENIRLNDPTGPLADDALMASANSYFLRGRFSDADYHYGLLRSEYPRSEHQYEAHILGLQCKLRIYQGPDYDGKPLEEAERLVKQLRTQFAGELDEAQQKRLTEVSGQVKKETAGRLYHMAQHFENIGYNRAAKVYYAQVVRDHAASDLSSRARTRLAALADAPDAPPVPLKTVVDLFPENAERSSIAQVPLIFSDPLSPDSQGIDATQVELATRNQPGTSGSANDEPVRR